MQKSMDRVAKIETEMMRMNNEILPIIRKSLFWYKLNVVVVVASIFVKIWLVK